MSEELKVTGRIVAIKDVVTGVSKAGKEWQKRDFAIETFGQYPKLVAFSLFGEKTGYTDKFSVGSQVEVKFNLESREFGDKYFTNVNAYPIQTVAGEQQVQDSFQSQDESSVIQSKSIKQEIMDKKENEPEPESDDLPF